LAGKEIVTPANPAAGYNKLYCKADDLWYTLDSDGNEVAIAGAGGAHNLLSASHLDTLAAAVVAGDVLFGNATPKWARLAKADNDDVLTLKAGLPSWEPSAGGGVSVGRVDVEEDFEGLAVGNIDTQDGGYAGWGAWSVTADADCTAEIVDIGGADDQILRLERVGAANAGGVVAAIDWDDLDNNYGLRTGFIIKWRWRISDVTEHAAYLYLYDSADAAYACCGYTRQATSKFAWIDALNFQEQFTVVNNTWYTTMFVARGTSSTDLKVEIYLDGDYLATETFNSNGHDQWDRLYFRLAGGTGAGTVDISDFRVYNLGMVSS